MYLGEFQLTVRILIIFPFNSFTTFLASFHNCFTNATGDILQRHHDEELRVALELKLTLPAPLYIHLTPSFQKRQRLLAITKHLEPGDPASQVVINLDWVKNFRSTWKPCMIWPNSAKYF